MKLYSFSQAARYLGKHKQTLEKWQRSGELVPDFKLGTRRFFRQDTLDKFRDGQAVLMTVNDIACKYNLKRSYVYYALRTKRNVQEHRRGKYAPEAVQMIANTEGWNETKKNLEGSRPQTKGK